MTTEWQPRRIVTALDDEGKSYLVRVEPVPPSAPVNVPADSISRSYPQGPPAVHAVWSCDELPFALPADPQEIPTGAHPGPLGLRLSVTVFPPGWRGEMFWSNRVDFLWMMSGRLLYTTDRGDEIVFGSGDIVIQNGTNKAFLNNWDEPAIMGSVLCGAVRRGNAPPAHEYHGPPLV